MRTRALSALLSLLLVGWASDDVPLPRGLDPHGIDEDCGRPVRRPTVRRDGAAPLPSGRSIGALDAEACASVLRGHGVPFEAAEGGGVAQPIRLRGPLGGLRLTPEDAVFDCRLAVAILAWAPDVRAQGVARIEHVSVHRPGARVAGTRRVSGHAHALAIDALAFVLEDGTRLTVLDAWVERTRGADPCAERDDDPRTARMRRAVCAAVERDLFQVVLTPHHDDAHANHVHLEVRPGVEWSFVR